MYPYHHRIALFIQCLLYSILIFPCNAQKQENNIKIDQAQGPNPWTNLNWNNHQENFQFVVVTDRTGGNRPGVFEQGVEKVNLLQPEFVMSVGDLIQGYTEDVDELNSQWDEFDQFVDNLDMPFFYVAGNHDITNKVMEDLWAQRYGRTYYHFVYQNVLFLCLNSEEPIPIDGDPHGSYDPSDFYLSNSQKAYISETLEDHKEVRWTFVFWHKPVWLYEESDNPRYKEQLPHSGWSEVEELLKERKHTVFAGHIHRYVHRERNNSDYITLATTGGGSALRGPIFGQFDHVLWVTMTDEGPIMANLLLQGIFDKDFSKEDIKKHLELTLKHKSLRVDNIFDDELPPDFQSINLTLFNHHDVPVVAKVELTDSENISYLENLKSLSIPPNSAASLEVKVKLHPMEQEDIDSDSKDPLWGELKTHDVRWTLIYDFEKHGQIEINGTKSIY